MFHLASENFRRKNRNDFFKVEFFFILFVYDSDHEFMMNLMIDDENKE